MKRLLFVTLLILNIVSCGVPKDIMLPNKKVTVDNGIVNFNGKPYTGKINLGTKKETSGFVTVKNGQLDGLTDVDNKSKKISMKFNVVESKLDGELVIKNEDQKIDMTVSYSKGKIIKLIGNFSENIKYNLTFKDGLAHGWFESGGEKFTFIDGITSLTDGNIKADVKYYINQETGNMGMESFINGESMGKKEMPNKIFNMEYFKMLALSSVSESNVE